MENIYNEINLGRGYNEMWIKFPLLLLPHLSFLLLHFCGEVLLNIQLNKAFNFFKIKKWNLFNSFPSYKAPAS